MQFIILCQGDGARWGNFLGTRKHFIRPEGGMRLVERTVHQFMPHGQVTVVGPDEEYRIPGSRLAVLSNPQPWGSNIDKLVACEPVWATEDRTIILMGDVWYSDEAVRSIARHQSDAYHVWRRPGPSRFTGHPYDETFAVSFGPTQHRAVMDAAVATHRLATTGRAKDSFLRLHLGLMAGLTAAQAVRGEAVAECGMQTHIDDWTDDFDTPADYVNWVGRRMIDAAVNTTAVCIPWRPGDRHRTRSYGWSRAYWQSQGATVVDGSGPTRSAMRNDAARRAFADGFDNLFFADADTFVPAEQFVVASIQSQDTDQFVLAFDEYMRLPQSMNRRMDAPIPHTFYRLARSASSPKLHHASGAHAMSRTLWERVGGYDERFTRWGFEDRCIWLTANTLAGEHDRIPGPAYHWWHPNAPDKDPGDPEYLRGEALAQRYKAACAYRAPSGLLSRLRIPDDAKPDPVALRAILTEPGGPLAEPVAVT